MAKMCPRVKMAGKLGIARGALRRAGQDRDFAPEELLRLNHEPPQWLLDARRRSDLAERQRGADERNRQRRAKPEPTRAEMDLMVEVRTDGDEPGWHPATGVVRYVGCRADTTWITKPMLRTRGWTDTAIRDFLPDPEGHKANPRYSSSAPMPVWSPRTVALAEARDDWTAWLDKSLTRRKSTLAALALPSGIEDRFDDKLNHAAQAIESALDENADAAR